MGKTKEAVLPLPVDARAKMWEDVFWSRKGITVFWMGVGVL